MAAARSASWRSRAAPGSSPTPTRTPTWFVVIEGGGWVGVGDERTRVAAGEAVLWPADVPHAAWTEHSEMRAFVVEFSGADDSAVLAGRALELEPGQADPVGARRGLAGRAAEGARRDGDRGRAGLTAGRAWPAQADGPRSVHPEALAPALHPSLVLVHELARPPSGPDAAPHHARPGPQADGRRVLDARDALVERVGVLARLEDVVQARGARGSR